MEQAVRAGSVDDLQREGRLLTKVGSLPVLVVWHDGRAYAIEDRCPHLGFPLHQGTVEAGLVTCHWHHARFDLASGCTLDPWADDAIGFDVALEDGRRPRGRPARGRSGRPAAAAAARRASSRASPWSWPRPRSGSWSRVVRSDIVGTALDFGTTYRDEGWGSGLTVLVAMANLLPALDPADRPLALVHALAFVSRDTRGRAPRFPEPALGDGGHDLDQVGRWYRRFVETRSSDAAERSLATIVHERRPGRRGAGHVRGRHRPRLHRRGAHARLHEQGLRGACASSVTRQRGRRHLARPPDLRRRPQRGERRVEPPPRPRRAWSPAPRPSCRPRWPRVRWRRHAVSVDVPKLAWTLLEDDPERRRRGVLDAVRAGAHARGARPGPGLTPPRCASPASTSTTTPATGTASTTPSRPRTRSTRPWAASRRPSCSGASSTARCAVYLDRFLNVPAARLPPGDARRTLDELAACWDVQGAVDEAGQPAYGFLQSGGRREALIAALGHALIQEDAGFHWFQVVEAGARQAMAWPEGSEESALILTGVARFLAAHTPTRRELATVVRTAARLRRGEALYAEA